MFQGKIDVMETVIQLRKQRAFAIQNMNQYQYVYQALIEYSKKPKNLVKPRLFVEPTVKTGVAESEGLTARSVAIQCIEPDSGLKLVYLPDICLIL